MKATLTFPKRSQAETWIDNYVSTLNNKTNEK